MGYVALKLHEQRDGDEPLEIHFGKEEKGIPLLPAFEVDRSGKKIPFSNQLMVDVQ